MEEHLISEIRKYGKSDLEDEAEYVRMTAQLKQDRKEKGLKGEKIEPRKLK